MHLKERGLCEYGEGSEMLDIALSINPQLVLVIVLCTFGVAIVAALFTEDWY